MNFLKLLTNQNLCNFRNSIQIRAILNRQISIEVTKTLPDWKEKLKKAGVGDIDFNLKCIIAHVLQKKFNEISSYENIHFNEKQYKDFERYCECRVARMPLQYILGEWDFMDLTLKMHPEVFIPRPETEEFVRLFVKNQKINEKLNILEVGCGCGAISLAILKALPNVTSIAIDLNKVAIDLAIENAKILNLNDRFKVYHHTMTKDEYLPKEFKNFKFNAIVSNPPYVKAEEFQYLAPEVIVYENIKALDGGPNGLKIARIVCDLACEHLLPGGKLWMELGNSHPTLMKTMISLVYKTKLKYISGYFDQYERERFVEIERLLDQTNCD